MKVKNIKKMNYQIFSCVFFLTIMVSFGQVGGDDPRSEGQYMDYANLKMTESPTASAFNAVSEIQVNHAKGTPVISIPIYTYELDGVQVPISLTYDASGIKVSQMATAVGLGWSLDAGGQISRTVRSKPDEEFNDGWFYDGYIRPEYYANKDANDKNWQQQMKGHYVTQYKTGLVKKRDHNPDLFSYSFNGYAGSYIHDTEMNIIKEKNDGIKILPLGNADDNLDAFDLNGNYYYFDYEDTERSNNKNIHITDSDLQLDFFHWEKVNGLPIVSSWKLSHIETKNNKKINFQYESEEIQYNIPKESWQIALGSSCDPNSENPLIKSSSGSNVEYIFNVQLLKKIFSADSNIEIEFQYASDTNLPPSVWKKKLTKIIIKEGHNKREFHFSYSRFSGDPRLRLDQVQEVTEQNGIVLKKPPYIFNYEPGSLPSKESKAQDFYGYYNLSDNNKGLLPNNFVIPTYNGFREFFNKKSGNRGLNINGLKRGILTDITYPTGGKTLFVYEPNVKNLNPISGYVGGLRIKEVKNQNEEELVFNRKTYEYGNLEGIDLETEIYTWFYKREGSTDNYYSHPIRLPGDESGYRSGFYYGLVTEKIHNNSETFKIEYRFKENLQNYQSFDYMPESEIIYSGTSASILKMTEYDYSLISETGSIEVLDWYVVGDMDCYYPTSMPSQIGYTTTPRKVRFSGNYAYLPTTIITTDYVSGNHPITVVKDITYDPETLLKKEEITDFTKKRLENGQLVTNDVKAEKIRVEYTYPFDVTNVPSGWPLSTVIKQEVFTTKDQVTAQTGGKAFVFDDSGNIKTIYEYAKGMGSNTSSLDYVPSHYEERTSFIFDNGFPVQVRPYAGAPTSYIWNLKGNVPVAKIEGRRIGSINEGFITELENASYTELDQKLETFRSSLLNQNIPFLLTTYAYTPLHGVSVITDPKDDKTTFEYDAFGRLKFVRDSEGNILSENEYKYALDLP